MKNVYGTIEQYIYIYIFFRQKNKPLAYIVISKIIKFWLDKNLIYLDVIHKTKATN